MNDIRTATIRAIHDALSLRGLEHGGGGFIRTSTPDTYMDVERLRLAREVLRHLPAGVSLTNAEQFAEQLSPIVLRTARPDAEVDPPAEPGRIRLTT